MEYKGLLMRDLQCDYDSVSYFVRLVRIGKPEGYMEALGILHHFLKDKDLATTPHDPQRPLSVQNSKWLKGACLGALEAIANPQDWEQGPAINAKGALKGGKGTWSPFEDPAGGERLLELIFKEHLEEDRLERMRNLHGPQEHTGPFNILQGL